MQFHKRFAWDVASDATNAPREFVHSLAQELWNRYTGADRHYHNLAHVLHCLDMFNAVRASPTSPQVVRTAIYYHDAVYDPKTEPGENEELSAALACTHLRELGYTASYISRVCEVIEHGTTHQGGLTDKDCMVIADVDLSILGACSSAYQAYTAGIRKEYAWYSDTAFALGRAHFLEKFLARPRIFYTTQYQLLFEERARENLQRELDQIRM